MAKNIKHWNALMNNVKLIIMMSLQYEKIAELFYGVNEFEITINI